MPINAILTHVLSTYRKQGWVSPIIYATSRAGMVRAFFLESLEGEPDQKGYQLFQLGREKGQAYPQDQLAEITLASQVWITTSHLREPVPAQPTRKKGVACWHIANTSPWQMTAELYQIQHDSAGAAVELVLEPEKAEMQQIILLPVWAFCAGWRSRSLTDAQVEVQRRESLRVFLAVEDGTDSPSSAS